MKTPHLPKEVSTLSARRSFLSWGASVNRLRTLGLAALAGSSLLFAGSLHAANTELDVANGLPANSDLSAGTSYTPGTAPTATSDVTFNATNTYNSPYTFGSAITIGSLNDLSATPITLSGSKVTLAGGDSVSGNTGDLLYVASGASLTDSQALQLGQTGNFDVVGTSTLSGVITDGSSGNAFTPGANAFGLVKTGTGTLILTNNDTFTGGTTVNAGTLQLNFGGNSYSGIRGTATVNAGGTLVLNAGDALGYNAPSAGNSLTQLNINGGTVDIKVNSNEGFTTNLNMTGGTFSSTGGGAFNIDPGQGNAPTITTNASATTALISANVVNRSGATSLPINVASGTTASGSDLTISGVVSSGGGGITKNGNGNLTLSAANTYTGATTVNAGTLTLTGSLSTSSALVTGGGTLAYAPTTAGSTQTVNGTAVNAGNSTLSATAGNTLALGAVTHKAGGLVTFGGAGTVTTSGSGTNGILGPYAYIGTGTGLSYVTPTGTVAAYTGGTTTTDATGVTDTTGAVNYNVPAGGAVGAGASANTLRYTGAAGTITGTTTLNGLMNAGTGALVLSNQVNIGSTNELVVLSNGQNITLNGVVNGGTTQSLTYGGPGAGTLTVTANNTYSGGTTINGGTLQDNFGGQTYGALRGTVTINTGGTLALNAGDALGYSAISANNSAALLNINGGTVDIKVNANQGFTAALTMTGGLFSSTGGGAFNINPAAANAPTITTNASATTALISANVVNRAGSALPINVAAGAAGKTNGSDLTISGVISGGGITKNGAGALTLTGTNTYTGGTSITAGTLLTGATGKLGTGNVTLSSTGALTLGNSTTIANTATLSFAGTTTITLNNSTADSLNNIVDTDSGAATPSFTAGTSYSAAQLDSLFNVTSFTGSGLLTIAVPEPGTWIGGLVLLGGAFGVARRRLTGARLG